MALKYNEIQNIIDEPPPPYSIAVNNSNNINNDYNLCCDSCYNLCCNSCCNYLDYINKKIGNWCYMYCTGLKNVITCCDTT